MKHQQPRPVSSRDSGGQKSNVAVLVWLGPFEGTRQNHSLILSAFWCLAALGLSWLAAAPFQACFTLQPSLLSVCLSSSLFIRARTRLT